MDREDGTCSAHCLAEFASCLLPKQLGLQQEHRSNKQRLAKVISCGIFVLRAASFT